MEKRGWCKDWCRCKDRYMTVVAENTNVLEQFNWKSGQSEAIKREGICGYRSHVVSRARIGKGGGGQAATSPARAGAATGLFLSTSTCAYLAKTSHVSPRYAHQARRLRGTKDTERNSRSLGMQLDRYKHIGIQTCVILS